MTDVLLHFDNYIILILCLSSYLNVFDSSSPVCHAPFMNVTKQQVHQWQQFWSYGCGVLQNHGYFHL